MGARLSCSSSGPGERRPPVISSSVLKDFVKRVDFLPWILRAFKCRRRSSFVSAFGGAQSNHLNWDTSCSSKPDRCFKAKSS
ncbi:hypothetical protein Plhal304r1_c004g0014701 [Plasmopara halstedii]